MNLKALFNVNFLKENLKKSAGSLAFFLGIVPIINIIILIICLINKIEFMEFNLLSLTTILGLFIIPIVLSKTLFGFVFKAKSVDFIMSKPLSRKTIYFTNIIGGILVLIAFMLINSLIIGVFGLFSNLVVPFNLLIDYFIFFLISYIFLFICSVVAVSFTGNFITSIVVLLLVVFLFPFFSVINYGFFNSSVTKIKCNDDLCKPLNYNCYDNNGCINDLNNNIYHYNMVQYINQDYTVPTEIFKSFATDSNTVYRGMSIIKMSILSIVYLSIGYLIFKNRKMEENEVSFKNEFKHYFIKSLTLLPICLITYMLIKEGVTGFIISLTITIIYYLIYDLITRKEIYRLLKSLGICLITFALFNGFYALYDNLDHYITIDVSNINSITLQSFDDLTITDKNIIKSIIKDSINYTEYDTIINFDINGKKYYANMNLTNKVRDQIKNIYENHITKKVKELNIKNISYASLERENISIPLTNKFQKILSETFKNYQYIESENYITLYQYINHEYNSINIPLNASEELYSYVVSYLNKNSLKVLNSSNNAYFYTNNNESFFTDEETYTFEYIINSNIKEFKNYLEKNSIKQSNNNIKIYFNITNKTYCIIISDTKKFREEFNKYKEKVKDNSDYKNMLNDYKNMSEEENEY